MGKNNFLRKGGYVIKQICEGYQQTLTANEEHSLDLN
jgi:hypothetical protein